MRHVPLILGDAAHTSSFVCLAGLVNGLETIIRLGCLDESLGDDQSVPYTSMFNNVIACPWAATHCMLWQLHYLVHVHPSAALPCQPKC